jgi:hypothetical protein
MHFYKMQLQKVTIGILSFCLMKKKNTTFVSVSSDNTTSKLCMRDNVKNAANLSFGEGAAVMILGKKHL